MHLDGRLKAITHPGGEYFHNQTIKCIPKLGMPKINSSDYGDLIIKFDVKFPQSKFLSLKKIKVNFQYFDQLIKSKLSYQVLFNFF